MGYENVVFDKNVVFLVTGGAGFIGSNICEVLVKRGHKVRCLDNLSNGNVENVDSLMNFPNFEFIEGDVRNYETCLQVSKNVDFILHQAAWGSVPRSIKIPLTYEENNIKGTLNMMEAARQNKVKKFVYASSSSVYGDHDSLPKKEGVEGTLLSPYALTKKTNEDYGKLYYNLYGLETYGLRYFNVFGKRQNPDGDYAAVIPKFIKQALSDETSQINGDGTQTRDFTYIENVIEANLKACKSDSFSAGRVFNIAFGGRETVIKLYYEICKLLNKKPRPVFGSERAGDIKHSNADIQKAIKFLEYNPEYDLKKGLEASIKWYKEALEK